MIECYKQCEDQPTFSECNDDFLTNLEEKCETFNSAFMIALCKRKAQRWKDYMDEHGEDYYEEI